MKRTGVLGSLLLVSLLAAGCGDKGTKDDQSDDSAKPKKSSDAKDTKSASASPAMSSSPGSSATTPPPPAPTVAVSGLVHVVDDCKVVVRVDVQKVLANPNVQKDIIPALDANLKLQMGLALLGVDYKKSASDAVLCVIDSDKKAYALLIGGTFPPESLLPAIAKLDSTAKMETVDGRQATATKDNELMGQAADGVFILAPRASFQTFVKAKNADTKLASGKDVSFMVRDDFIAAQSAKIPELKGVSGISGFIDLTGLKIESTGTFGSPENANKVLTLLNAMQGEALKKPSSNAFGEMELVKDAKATVAGSVLTVSIPIPAALPGKLTAMVSDKIKNAK